MLFAAVIFGCATFLIFHCQYEDGVIGRLALGVMAMSQLVVLLEWLFDAEQYAVLPTTAAVQAGMALFMLRHVYRFLRWRTRVDYQWRKAIK